MQKLPLAHKVDMRFRYTNSVETDIAKTFERVRRERLVAETPEPDRYLHVVGRALRIDGIARVR